MLKESQSLSPCQKTMNRPKYGHGMKPAALNSKRSSTSRCCGPAASLHQYPSRQCMGIVCPFPVDSWNYAGMSASKTILFRNKTTGSSRWLGSKATERSTSQRVHVTSSQWNTFFFLTNLSCAPIQTLDRPAGMGFLEWDQHIRDVVVDMSCSVMVTCRHLPDSSS